MNACFRALLPFALVLPLTAQTNVCTASETVSGCGPSLTVQFVPQGASGGHDLTLSATGLHPASHGLMVWGTTQINVPLGNGCSLLTDFLWGHLIHTDDLGEWAWSRNWPGSVQGYYYMQVGSFTVDALGALDIRATGCWFAECTL